MKSRLLLVLAALGLGLNSGCTSSHSAHPTQAPEFALSRYASFEFAPLRRADGQPVRDEIRAAIEASLVQTLETRGLHQATSAPADLTVLTQGGVRPRNSVSAQRYTATTGIPVVRSRSFDIDDQNDASLMVTLIDRSTGQAVWQNSWSRSFASRHPTPDQVREAMQQVLAPLANRP